MENTKENALERVSKKIPLKNRLQVHYEAFVMLHLQDEDAQQHMLGGSEQFAIESVNTVKNWLQERDKNMLFAFCQSLGLASIDKEGNPRGITTEDILAFINARDEK